MNVSTKPTVALLKLVPFFAGLAPDELAALADKMGRRFFGKGVIIFHKGSLGQSLYVVQTGRVRAFALSLSGQQLSLNQFGPGDCFGEMSMIDGKSRSAGAMCMEDTVVLTLQRQEFWRHLDTNPHTATGLLTLLCDRLRASAESVESLVFHDAGSRIAAKLLEFVRQADQLNGTGVANDLRISQDELATWVGLRRESVNRILNRWRRQGIIEIERQVIIVKDEARLARQITH